jgi:hypothetical protein
MILRYILFGLFLRENGVENVLLSVHEEFDITNAKYKLGFFLGCEAEALFKKGIYFGSHLDFYFHVNKFPLDN